MYKRWVLDCIPNLAHAVAVDFSARLELYKELTDATAEQLTQLQGRYGFEPNLPNDTIRVALMKPVFGESDGHGPGNDGSIFQSSRLPVLEAAADFSGAEERTLAMHRERTRSAIIPFRRFLEDLDGASLDQTEIRMRAIFETGEAILKEAKVAAVFGVSKTINAAWPLDSTDPEGAKLIGQITTQLANTPYGVISRDRFVRMQRIAQEGQESVRFIVDTDIESISVTDDALDPLLRLLYAWGSDLGLIGTPRPQTEMARPQPSYTAAATVAARAGRTV
jgi:hypothetical protein